MLGFYQEYGSGKYVSYNFLADTTAAAEPIKGDRQIRLLEAVDILKRALDLFKEDALALAHFAAGLADDEVVDRPFEYELIPTPLAGHAQLLNNAEGLQHLKISVDAGPVDSRKPILKVRLDFGKRKRTDVIIDEELNQDPARRGDALAVVAQNSKKVFVFSHRGISLTSRLETRHRFLMLHEALSKCNK